jgi:hypothetical protein
MGGIGSPAWGYGNFGPISVTVGSTTVPLTYAQAGYPTIGFPSPVSLGTGGTMTFRGGGACGVPAFDITATIPGHAVLASPAPTADGGAPVIDTSQDLSVTWPAISIGQAHFDLSGGSWQIGDTAITVRCTFDGSAGSGTVSHTLLSSLKTMAGTTPVYADMWSDLEVTTVVSGLTITTQSGPGSTAADRAFNVTLQ